jgi:hypothetical protein
MASFTLPRRPLDLQDLAAELFVPRISARMNERGESIWAPDVYAFAEPCYCDRCDGAKKLRGVPCEVCGELMWGCASLGCPNEETCGIVKRIRARHRPAFMATRIQSLWRGYKSRKDIADKNAEEIAVVEDHWRHYDEKYRTYVLCQNLVVALKKNDPSYDVTQTPYYIWMLETGGPWIEEAEEFMRLRGWVRPKSTKVNLGVLRIMCEDIFKHCGLTDEEQRIGLGLMDSFIVAVGE